MKRDSVGKLIRNQDGSLDCVNTYIAFGFEEISRSADATSVLPRENIYGCMKLIVYTPEEDVTKDSDFVLLRLDRPVTVREQAPVEFYRPPSSEHIFDLGFPFGLPLKLTSGVVHSRRYTDKFLRLNRDEKWMSRNEMFKKTEWGSQLVYKQTHGFSGGSGGPSVNEKGNVWGVHISSSNKYYLPNDEGLYKVPSYGDATKVDSKEQYYRYSEAKDCVEALDCEDDSTICKIHTASDALERYRNQLEELGVNEE